MFFYHFWKSFHFCVTNQQEPPHTNNPLRYCWFLYIQNRSKIVNFLRKQAWTKSLFACKLVIHYKHILKPNILSKRDTRENVTWQVKMLYMSFFQMQGELVWIGLWRQLLSTTTFSKVQVHFTRVEAELALERKEKNRHMWMWHFFIDTRFV